MEIQPEEELGTITNELVDMGNSEHINELKLRRSEIRANELMDKFPGQAHNVLAIVNSLRNKYAEAAEHHRAAVNWFPYSADMSVNYGVTLAAMGKLKLAIEKFKHAESLEPTRVDLKEFIIKTAYNAAMFKEANSILEDYAAKGQLEQLPIESISQELIQKGLELMDEYDLDDDDLLSIASVAWTVSSEFSTKNIKGFFDDDSVYFQYGLRASPSKISQLNIELADQLAKADINPSALTAANFSFCTYADE